MTSDNADQPALSDAASGPSSPTEPEASVARNILWLLLTQPVMWLTALLTVTVVPRYLGPGAMGRLGIAEAVWAMVGAFMSLGTEQLITRETAQRPQSAGPLLGRVLMIRSAVFAVASIGVGIYVRVQDLEQETAIVVAVLGVSALAAGWTMAQRAVMTGREKMGVLSLVDIAARLLGGVTLVLAVVLDLGIIGVAGAMASSALLYVIVLSWALHRDAMVRVQLPRRGHVAVVRSAAPFFWLQLAVVFYHQIDIVMIAMLVDEVAVGWYSAADRLFGTMLFLPGVVGQALFPNLARRFISDPDGMRADAQRAIVTLGVVILPVTVGVLVLAPAMIELLMGPKFHGAAPVLRVYAVVIVPVAMTTVFGSYAQAINRQKLWTKVVIVSALATIPLDLVLVPLAQDHLDNGAIAGAFAYLLTETGAVLVGALVLLPGTFPRHALARFARGIAAAASMGAVVYACSGLFLGIPIVAGAITYPVFALVFGVLDDSEMAMLRKLAGRVAPFLEPKVDRNPNGR